MKAMFTYNLSDVIAVSIGLICVLSILVMVAYVEICRLIKKVRKVFKKC